MIERAKRAKATLGGAEASEAPCIYKHPIPIQEPRAEEGGGLIIHHGLIIILYGINF